MLLLWKLLSSHTTSLKSRWIARQCTTLSMAADSASTDLFGAGYMGREDWVTLVVNAEPELLQSGSEENQKFTNQKKKLTHCLDDDHINNYKRQCCGWWACVPPLPRLNTHTHTPLLFDYIFVIVIQVLPVLILWALLARYEFVPLFLYTLSYQYKEFTH